jgi:hypothetical protein
MNEPFLEPILRKMRATKITDILCLLFIVLAIITRIAIYIYNPNFWSDEAALAQSIFLTDFKDILHGNLPANQTAPLGFLLLVKILSLCFGYSEYSLRIIPLLAGILVFPIAYSFAIREFDKKFACIFLFFLTISPPLLFYNIQFKQYATEILVSLIYLNSFCLNRKAIIEKAKIPLSLALIAPVGMFFSNASIFVLAGLFAFMLFEQWKAKQIKLFLRNNWLKILIIAAILLCYYLLWINQVKSVKSGFMSDYWKGNNMKFTILWIDGFLKSMLGYFIYVKHDLYLNCILFASSFLFGLVFLFREKRYMFFAILTGIIFYLAAYFLGKYPLISGNSSFSLPLQLIGCRFFVHFFPIVLIVPSFAIFKLLESEKFRKLAFIVLIVMPCFAFYFSYQKTISGLEISRVSELIETIEDDNSAVVIIQFTAPTYYYYRFLEGKKTGEVYLLSDIQLPADILEYFKFPGYSAILVEPNLKNFELGINFKGLLSNLENKGYKKAYFIFLYTKGFVELQSHLHYLLYVKNYFPPEKTFLYEHQGVSAILVEF